MVGKVLHGEAAIEALSASIAHRGLILNLVAEPEMKGDKPTGAYFVNAGEGLMLSYLLRAKCNESGKNHPVRCHLEADPETVDEVAAYSVAAELNGMGRGRAGGPGHSFAARKN